MYKKSTLLVLAIFILANLTYAQTPVSGVIHANTTWTKANSPYLLTGTVGVPAAYTLIIEPGVVVERTSDFQILINGSVQFQGTQVDSIVFTSDNSLTFANSFFIEFQKSNLDNSTLRYLNFSNASGGANDIRLGNEDEFTQTSPKNSGTLKISRSNLSYGYSATKGYQAANSLDIDSCTLISSTLWGYYPRSEQINVSNSTVSAASVTSDSYNFGITFTNCPITNSTFKTGCCGANLSFTGCTVEDSYVDNSQANYDNPITINNCIFLNTPLDIENAQFILENSVFVATKQLHYSYDPNTEIAYLLRAWSVTMNNCQMIDLSGRGYSGIYIAGGSIAIPVSIKNNIFNSLNDAIYIHDFSTITLDSNNFTSIARYHIANYSFKDFSALNNYFELKPGQTFYDIIFDNNHDLTYGAVNYTPYSSTLVTTAPISKPANVIKITNNGDVAVRWNKNKEPNLKSYRVYWGYIDGISYKNSANVLAIDTLYFIKGGSINDSIAVTALNTSATGTNDQQAGFESWFSPALETNATLALSLINFSGFYADNKTFLTWQTSQTLNDSYFDIQRSADGITFNTIGLRNVVISGASSYNYAFTDSFTLPTDAYYRLKKVGKDNSVDYSNIIKISPTAIQNNFVKVYPNPAKDYVTILSTDGFKEVIIVNNLGQKVMALTPPSGNAQLTINISLLPSGIYRILAIKKSLQTQTGTFVK